MALDYTKLPSTLQAKVKIAKEAGFSDDEIETVLTPKIAQINQEAASVVSGYLTPKDVSPEGQAVLQQQNYQLPSNANTTAAQEKLNMSRESANRVIQQLEELYYGAKTSADDLSKGRLGGVLATGGALLGVNQPATTYKQARESSGAQLARALGDVGNLNEREQANAIKLLPTLFSTPEEAAAGFKAIRAKLGLPETEIVPSEVPSAGQRLMENPTAQAFAKFGQNAQNDTNQIVEGLKGLPGAIAKTGSPEATPFVDAAKLLASMGVNVAKGYGELATNPVQTVTEKPVSTFLNLLPFAQGIRNVNTANLPVKKAPVETVSTVAETAKPNLIDKIKTGVKTKAAEDLLRSGSGSMNKAFDAGIDPRKIVLDNKLSGNYDDILGPIEQKGYSGQIGQKMSIAESKIQNTLANSNKAISWQPVIQELEAMKTKLSKGNLKGNVDKIAALDDEIKYYKAQPSIPSGEALDVIRAANETFGNSIINETKGAISTQVNKVIANTLRDTLKSEFPDIAEALKQQQGLIITREILKDARGSASRGGLSGVTRLDITQPLRVLEPILKNARISSKISSGGGKSF